MNARIAKLALTLCSLSLLGFANSLPAQDTNAAETPQPASPGRRGGLPPNFEAGPTFDIQIEHGELSLAAFKNIQGRNPWGTNTSSVDATVDNLSKYLRAIDPGLNIVLSPDVGNIVIPNLKLNTRLPRSISQAVSVASGGEISGPIGAGGGLGAQGDRSLTFIANRPRGSKSSVEVFNLSGYIQSLGKVDAAVVRQKLDELQELIATTLKELPTTKESSDLPDFKYHPGTKLFIVIGKPEAIEVTRKIVNALSGQQSHGREDLLESSQPSGQN